LCANSLTQLGYASENSLRSGWHNLGTVQGDFVYGNATKPQWQMACSNQAQWSSTAHKIISIESGRTEVGTQS